MLFFEGEGNLLIVKIEILHQKVRNFSHQGHEKKKHRESDAFLFLFTRSHTHSAAMFFFQCEV